MVRKKRKNYVPFGRIDTETIMVSAQTSCSVCPSLLLFTFTFRRNYNRARQLNFAKARRRSSARERERRPSTVKFKAATFGKYRRPRTRSKARGTNEKVSSPFDVFRRVSTTTRPAQKLALPCAAPLVNDTRREGWKAEEWTGRREEDGAGGKAAFARVTRRMASIYIHRQAHIDYMLD